MELSLSRPTDGKTISNKEMGFNLFEQNLTKILWKDNSPLIIGLFGSRGAGKTSFAKNWVESLKTPKKIVYFSAWDYDDQTDPLQAIVNEMRRSFPEKDINELVASTGKLLSLTVSIPLQTLAFAADLYSVRYHGHLLGLSALISPLLKSVTGFFKKEKVNPLTIQQEIDKAKKDLKTKLNELVTIYNNIVIVIDELDRCRPSFALQTLERIKHFFQIDGLKFVIIANDEQLYNSFVHEYGGDIKTNAPEYFRRFFDYGINFPEPKFSAFIEQLVAKLKIDNNLLNHQEILSAFTTIKPGLNMSLRDIEQSLAIAKFGKQIIDDVNIENNSNAIFLLLLIASLKATNHEKSLNYFNKFTVRNYSSMYSDNQWEKYWPTFARDEFTNRRLELAIGLFERVDNQPPVISFNGSSEVASNFQTLANKTPLQNWKYIRKYIDAITNLKTLEVNKN